MGGVGIVMARLAVLLAALALTACSGPLTGDVGCTLYQAQRGDMPRPIGSGPLAEWVAGLDAAMTGGCR